MSSKIISKKSTAVEDYQILKATTAVITDNELLELVEQFVSSFELVFDQDWQMTIDYISNCDCCEEKENYLISNKGTFLNPLVEDEGANWGNRKGLLFSYRRLREALEKYEKYSFERYLEIRQTLKSCNGVWN